MAHKVTGLAFLWIVEAKQTFYTSVIDSKSNYWRQILINHPDPKCTTSFDVSMMRDWNGPAAVI